MQDNSFPHVWLEALKEIEKELSRPSFDTWLKSTFPVVLQDDLAVIGVPNEFAKDWLDTRYTHIIKDALRKVLNKEVEIRLVIPSEIEKFTTADKPIPKGTLQVQVQDRDKDDEQNIPLNPKYIFETFVVGNSNRFAHAASLAVAEAPSKAYNPLFIYGGVGLGKTHLMHAIGHYVLDQNPKAKIVYLSSEKFTNELINAIKVNNTEEFRNKYRYIDVLLIDDIQFLAGKESTQEEFFHTFNSLYEANKQIIISSDRPPKEIPTLEDRLRSRFEWGLITDIQPPDLETRIAILRKKAQLENLDVPNDVMFYIATKIQANIRELEGSLNRVMAYSTLSNQPLTTDLAADALKDIIPATKIKPISIALIQEIVGQYFDMRVEDFKAKKRTRTIAFPRQIAMYLSRELTDCSLPKIGEEFGGRDHTTVIHAHEKISGDIQADANLASTIEQLKNKITNHSG